MADPAPLNCYQVLPDAVIAAAAPFSMDTTRLLLAFLAFGAACTTLWAWMLASNGSTGAATRPR